MKIKFLLIIGILMFSIFLSIAPVQARTVIVDSCPSGADVYMGGISAPYYIGTTPFSYVAPSVQTGIMFHKNYYGWQQGYVGPNSPDHIYKPLYYWGGEPGNTMAPYQYVFCSAPDPTPTPYKAPDPTPTPYIAPDPTSVPKSGSVTIDSIPSGADVYMGTTKIGVTPFVYTLPSTQNAIIFKKSGYADKRAYISPSTNSPFVVSLSK